MWILERTAGFYPTGRACAPVAYAAELQIRRAPTPVALSCVGAAGRCCTDDAVGLRGGAFRPEIRGVGHPRAGTEDPRVGGSIPRPHLIRARTSQKPAMPARAQAPGKSLPTTFVPFSFPAASPRAGEGTR